MNKLNLIDNSWYLSFFRVAICLVLLIELMLLFPSLDEIYQMEGFVYTTDNSIKVLKVIRENIQLFIATYALLLVLYLLGIGKQFTGVLVFVCYTINYFLCLPTVSWGSEILRISLLFLAFTDSFKYLAIKKSKEPINLVYQLAVLSLMIHICYVYLTNAYFKLENDEWQTGYAIGYFMISVDSWNVFDVGVFALKYPWLIKSLSWFVLVFQILFPFLVWFKKTKLPIIIVGVILHVLMIFIAHLYIFEIVVILHYGLFISNKEWENIRKLSF